MKSPAMAEALKPLNRLEATARDDNDAAAKAFSIESEIYKLAKEEGAKKARAILKDGKQGAADFMDIPEPEEPKSRRYIVNDCSYEALGVVLADNPNGVLGFRDELVSLLKTLDREDNAAARGFYLSAWNGTGGYSFDRIIRGKTYIEAACLSLLGSTQPGRIAEYIRRASGGAGDDGLIQRFGLLVWPDQSPEWRNVDRYPDSAARAAAFETFTRLDGLDPDAIGCERDTFEPLPFLRFDNAAQELFEEWRADLENRLRSNELSPALESHLAKYRKLVPGLALIGQIADGGGAIGEAALLRALAFAEYLETHARRAYGAATEAETASAKAILARIQRGELSDGFAARDIYRKQWAHLSDREQVQAGLDLLTDCDWLELRTIPTSGRTRATYAINPRRARA
jgi:putative DNA primase/helicase